MSLGIMARPWDTPSWRRFRANRLALFGLALVAILAGLAAAAPVLPLPDPYATDLTRRLLPAGNRLVDS